MNELPEDYVTQYVYQYVGYVKERKDGILNGGCPICREGDSWGKKARFYYNPSLEGSKNTVYCHNCGYSKSSVNFIMDVSGLTYREVRDESRDYDIIPRDINYDEFDNLFENKSDTPTLPDNCINLFDKTQLEYYKENYIVKLAIKYVIDRKIHKAINRPKSLYVSLDDYIHKNRLIIPYYDNGKLVWYQSRKLLDDDSPKYLSKINSDRTLYNIDDIDEECPYIFVFEGAIDAMFVKNATCLSGITESGEFVLTDEQERQLSVYPLHDIVWILDSPYLDEAARKKSSMLFRRGEKVFQWPRILGEKCKDFNDIIMKSNKTKIPQEFILRNLMKEESNSMKLDVSCLKEKLKISLKV
jgi:hypothetical protein